MQRGRKSEPTYNLSIIHIIRAYRVETQSFGTKKSSRKIYGRWRPAARNVLRAKQQLFSFVLFRRVFCIAFFSFRSVFACITTIPVSSTDDKISLGSRSKMTMCCVYVLLWLSYILTKVLKYNMNFCVCACARMQLNLWCVHIYLNDAIYHSKLIVKLRCNGLSATAESRGPRNIACTHTIHSRGRTNALHDSKKKEY